jgi:hypothetical protein
MDCGEVLSVGHGLVWIFMNINHYHKSAGANVEWIGGRIGGRRETRQEPGNEINLA